MGPAVQSYGDAIKLSLAKATRGEPMRQAKWIVTAATVLFTPLASASDEKAADTKAMTLRVRASDTGRPEDLFLLENSKEQRLSKTVEAIAPLGPGCPEWKTLLKQHLADELGELRTK